MLPSRARMISGCCRSGGPPQSDGPHEGCCDAAAMAASIDLSDRMQASLAQSVELYEIRCNGRRVLSGHQKFAGFVWQTHRRSWKERRRPCTKCAPTEQVSRRHTAKSRFGELNLADLPATHQDANRYF